MGAVPALVGVAVNVTLVFWQMVWLPAVMAIDTVGNTIVTALLVAVVPFEFVTRAV